LGRLRQPEVAAIGARIDRIEQAMVQHELLGAIPRFDPGVRRAAADSRRARERTGGGWTYLSN